MNKQCFPYPQILAKGIHVLVLPFDKPMPIEALFPEEISGSSIELMNSLGQFEAKQTIVHFYGSFYVSHRYRTLHPFQVIRLTLKRTIKLLWAVQIQGQSRSGLNRPMLPCASGYSHEKALYLIHLCELVYESKPLIEQVLTRHYDFTHFHYFSRNNSNSLSEQPSRLRLLQLWLKSKETVVDLQFIKLIHYEEATQQHTILFIFKGSKEAEDWLTNFSAKGSHFIAKDSTRVHQGFQEAVKIFLETMQHHQFELNGEVFKFDESMLSKLNKNTRIILAGHSLGGAIATLAGSYFFEKGIHPNNLEVYSFGSPPIADKDFVEQYQNQFSIYRIVNSLDPVPKLDKVARTLFHVGEAIVLPSNDGELHLPIGYVDNLLDALEKKPIFSFVDGRVFL